jgi:hypothetical protein
MRARLTVFLFTFVLNASGQLNDTTFQKVFFSPSAPYMARTLAGTPDDGAMILGDLSYGKSALTLVDSAGTQIWTKSYSSSQQSNNSSLHFRDMIRTYDSSYVSVGYAMPSQSSVSYLTVMKTDLNGDTLWTARFNKAIPEAMTATAVHEGVDSSLLISGHGIQNSKGYVIKLDRLGNLIWERELADIGSIEPYGVTQLTDGSIHIVGNRYTGIPGQGAFVVSLDADGNFLSGQAISNAFVVDIVDHNGGLYLLGANGNYISLFKLDYSGIVQWKKSYYYTSLLDYSRKAYLRTLSDGNLALMYGDRWFTTQLMIFDSDGELLIQQNHMWGGIDVMETRKKGLFLIGYGPLYGVRMLNYDHTGIVRTDSLYTNFMCAWETFYSPLEASFQFAPITMTADPALVRSSMEIYMFEEELSEQPGCVEMWGGLSESFDIQDISVSPNPSGGGVTVEQPEGIPFALLIRDMSGRLVLEDHENKAIRTLDMTLFGPGVYLYETIFSTGHIRTGKLIIE